MRYNANTSGERERKERRTREGERDGERKRGRGRGGERKGEKARGGRDWAPLINLYQFLLLCIHSYRCWILTQSSPKSYAMFEKRKEEKSEGGEEKGGKENRREGKRREDR